MSMSRVPGGYCMAVERRLAGGRSGVSVSSEFESLWICFTSCQLYEKVNLRVGRFVARKGTRDIAWNVLCDKTLGMTCSRGTLRPYWARL